MASQNDVWAYDKQHPEGFNTLKGDENFKPPEADLPVHDQRRLSQTEHKKEQGEPMVSLTPEDAGENPETIIQRRRSSVSGQKRRPSRKATGSFGEGDSDLKPLSSLTSEQKSDVLNAGNNPLYFTGGLPTTTSGK